MEIHLNYLVALIVTGFVAYKAGGNRILLVAAISLNFAFTNATALGYADVYPPIAMLGIDAATLLSLWMFPSLLGERDFRSDMLTASYIPVLAFDVALWRWPELQENPALNALRFYGYLQMLAILGLPHRLPRWRTQ